MSGSGDSSDEDDWAVQELPLPKGQSDKNQIKKTDEEGEGDDWGGLDEQETVADNYWEVKVSPPQQARDKDTCEITKPRDSSSDGEPMILVDMTILSNSAIHNKFDKMSVNDSKAASDLRRKIESKYDKYANDSSLLADRIVIPCGTTVWRGALVNLRNETPGHYFAPIFPPKKKTT